MSFRELLKIYNLINSRVKVNDISLIIMEYLKMDGIYSITFKDNWYKTEYLIGNYTDIRTGMIDLLKYYTKHSMVYGTYIPHQHFNVIFDKISSKWIFDRKIHLYTNGIHFSISYSNINLNTEINKRIDIVSSIVDRMPYAYIYITDTVEEFSKNLKIVEEYYDNFIRDVEENNKLYPN